MKIFEITRPLIEDATAGATGSASVASVSVGLGSDVKDLVKKQKKYTNMIRRVNIPKVKI